MGALKVFSWLFPLFAATSAVSAIAFVLHLRESQMHALASGLAMFQFGVLAWLSWWFRRQLARRLALPPADRLRRAGFMVLRREHGAEPVWFRRDVGMIAEREALARFCGGR